MSTVKIYSSSWYSSLCLTLAAVYWAAATVLHEAISNKLVVPFKNMLGAVSTEYAFVVLTLGGIAALLWAVRCRVPRAGACAARGGPTSRPGSGFRGCAQGDHIFLRWLLLAAAVLLCSVFLMVTRIEMAHFPQYAILAVLLRLGGLSPASAYLAGQCGSIADEARQYLLHPRFTGYFDWNDLLINSVGLCIGLLLARGVSAAAPAPVSRWVARISGGLLALASCALLAGLASGHVRASVPLAAGQPPDPFPLVEGSRVLALFLREPPAFWQAGPFGQFHVMGVGEGMLLYPLCSLLLFICCVHRKNT